MAMETRLRGGVMASINVTPMADIMIVLLIIFMVVTPLISQGPVERLPAAPNAREEDPQGRILVSLTASRDTYLDSRRLEAPGELFPGLQARFAETPGAGRVVFVQADERLPFSEVQRVMDLCREAGAEQVALVARHGMGG